jgi:N-(2-amino-2-carboxyethyl)-L-glutamate synthase
MTIMRPAREDDTVTRSCGEEIVAQWESSGVLGAIGNTPTLKLTRVLGENNFEIYAKLEGMNPGGSMKDRAAAGALLQAIRQGYITGGTTVIESSSGNMAIGLAQACCHLGLKLICVLDSRSTEQNRAILRAYGVGLEVLSEGFPEGANLLSARMRRVKELQAEIPNSFWINQYANSNVAIGYHLLMREALLAIGRPIDYLFVPVSTCGLLRGCADFLRDIGMATRIVAVDAVGSVIFGGEPRLRLLPGHGAALVPGLFAPGLASDVLRVTDEASVQFCHRLVRTEGLLVGASSGAAMAAIDSYRRNIAPDSVCLAILPDRGERYLDTVFNAKWTSRHFGGDSLGNVEKRETGNRER